MNVCIKCGKCPLALDTYHHMRQDGCLPNVVTYNTLIDVYGKMGQWDHAVKILSTMKAEVRDWSIAAFTARNLNLITMKVLLLSSAHICVSLSHFTANTKKLEYTSFSAATSYASRTLYGAGLNNVFLSACSAEHPKYHTATSIMLR